MPLEKGGMRASLFTMFSATVGAGLLSLPKVFSSFGLAFGLALLCFFGFMTYLMKMVLNDLIIESKRKSYANLVSFYLGKVGSDSPRAWGSS
jgi:amino acid permease